MKFIRQLLSLFSVILFGSVAMLALRVAYQSALPERPPYSQGQERMAAQLAQDVESWMEALPPSQTRAVFANLDHDEFGFVGGPIRDAIWRSGRFDLAPRSLAERFRQRMGWTLPHWSSGGAVQRYARWQHASVAIAGSVLELTDAPHPALKAHLEITRPASGEIIAARDFAVQPGGAFASGDRKLFSAPPAHLRVLAWVALVLLLPLAIYPFARELLVEGSNGAVLLVLLALVALDVGSAYLLYANNIDGWMGTVLTLVIFGLSFGLNAQYLTWIKEQHV